MRLEHVNPVNRLDGDQRVAIQRTLEQLASDLQNSIEPPTMDATARDVWGLGWRLRMLAREGLWWTGRADLDEAALQIAETIVANVETAEA